MKSALLEIGVETLPSRFIAPALARLSESAEALLKENRLAFESVTVHGAPMRLALLITGLAERSAEAVLEVTGPPARVLKDEGGGFSKQAAGFARKHGIAPEELDTIELPKGTFLLARKTLEGEPSKEVLARIFPALIAGLDFPKTMVWEPSRFRFARPIRTLAALYGKTTIPFELAGVRAGNKVRGLAALGGELIKIDSPEDYAARLRDACVLVVGSERRSALRATLAEAAKRSRGELDPDPDLFETVANLTEHPVAVLGHFKEDYLELPSELLTMVLKKQLMFFPVTAPGGGLTADFIGVRDGVSVGQSEVQRGFERVIDARFSDARFFFGRDAATSLAKKAEGLSGVAFQRGLGTMADKTARLGELSRWITMELLQDHEIDASAVEKTAALAYADLLTGVVGEFPELQGTMGGVYARREGLGEKVALGLCEFHFPVAPKSPVPTLLEGSIVSLAGKLDTITAMIAAGFKPSGSEDPFGLRRLGNGVIRIVLEKQLALSLPKAVARAAELAAERGFEKSFDREAAVKDTLDFLWQRVESFFLERSFKIDEIRAVSAGGLDNVSRTFQRLAAVHAVRPDPDFVPLASAFKRAANILRQAGFDASSPEEVERELFSDPAEDRLFAALCRVEGGVREKAANGFYEEGLRSLVGLKPEVDFFFEKVLVMAEEAEVKRNRLNLLARLVRLFTTVADISELGAHAHRPIQ